MKINYKSVYLFKGIENLYSDENGSFFYNERPIKKKWRVGQVYVEVNKKRYGMNTLRNLAYKSIIKEETLPF